MANSKTIVSIVMGIIILIADIIWLVTPTGSNYAYASFKYDGMTNTNPPWLEMGIIIFIATVIWLVIDFSYLSQSMKKPAS